MTDNFDKDIDVPSKKKIMYDYNAKDCEQCSSDSICCYCKNIAYYKLEKQLEAKEQECEELKENLPNAITRLMGELDQLKAELKQYKKSKQASYEALQKKCNELELENRKLKAENEELKNRVAELSLFQLYKIQRDEAEETLIEIKEIATCCIEGDVARIRMKQILQKISEVLDE